MSSCDVDWPAIRAKHEIEGVSQSTLARAFGVSRQAIQQKAQKEHWITPLLASPQEITEPITGEMKPLAIAYKLMAKMANHAERFSEPKDIKLLKDALSQIHKIELLTPSDKQSASGKRTDLLQYLENGQLNWISDCRTRLTLSSR